MRARIVATVAALAALAALALLVLLHTTAPLDARVESWAWARQGAWTERLYRLTGILSPGHVGLGVATIALLVSMLRRTPRPVAVTLALCGVATVAELGLKWLLPRIELYLSGHGAAGFPSGHVVAAVAYTGALLMALRPDASRWLWAAVAALGVVMSAAVLMTALHTPTEVAGAWMLSCAVLTGASVVGDLGAPLRRVSGTLA